MEYYYYSFTCKVCYEKVTSIVYLENLDFSYNNYSNTSCLKCNSQYYLNRTKLVSYYHKKDGYLFVCDLKDNSSRVGKSHGGYGGSSYVEWIAEFDEPLNPTELIKRLKTILVFS